MKKIAWISLFLLLFVAMAACNNNENLGNKDSDSMDRQQENKNPANNHAQDESGKNTNDDLDIQGDKKNEEERAETVQALYKINPETWYIQPIDSETNEKVVLLTIDDAPDEYALEMAKTLKQLDAGAIFFVNGHFIESPEKKETLKAIHDMGFLIGNHTYSHKYLPDLAEEDQKAEILRVNDMIEDIIGERPAFFRAPNGANTDYSKEIAKQEDMVLMNWSYGYDWNKEYMSKDAITDIMLHTELLGNGANLLMHDREWTAAALHDIVVGLRDQGYEIVDPNLIQTK